MQVSWSFVPDDQRTRVRFLWQESGGPQVAPPKQKGFGSLLIERALRAELGGVRLDFDPQGVICTLDIQTASEH